MHSIAKRASLRGRQVGLLAAAVALVFAAGSAQALDIKPYYEFKKPKAIVIDGDISADTNGKSAPVLNVSASYLLGFEGVSQYDGASFTPARNFIPPDTMGAVGRTQYLEVSNGAYAVFDKATGNRTSLVSDTTFWAAAGQTGANGDTRVMYNAAASRWVVVAFGASTSDLQIAVSDSDNALGTWKSVKFTGYAGLGFGGTADYPTLALDKNAVYIGTNNFAPATSGGTNSFRSTTLNVIPIDSLFNATAPTVANMKQFVTANTIDNGFAIQGVNSSAAGTTGKVVAGSLALFDNLAYKVTGLSTSSATASTTTAAQALGMAAFTTAGAARQPNQVADTDTLLTDTITSNNRVVDTLDERTSSSVYEVNGRIYMVNTVRTTAGGNVDEARVRWTVIDSNTFAILAQGDIGSAGYDYYQGSIAVNENGEVVIGYDRSGSSATDGKITFMAQSFKTDATGALVALSGEIALKESLVDDYHNGTTNGFVAQGRQRWGDYSQVSVDPADSSKFWVVGEFAREYNDGALHPGGTGGSRWGTWIAVVAVPEPSTYLMMALGLGVLGFAARRRQGASRAA